MNSDPSIKAKRIHVFVNGNPSERIFFIHPKSKLSWPSIIKYIGDLLKPQKGPIRFLRKTDGIPICCYEELEENGKYIACGKENLIPIENGYSTESELNLKKELQAASASEIIKAVESDIKYVNGTDEPEIITIYVFINGEKCKPNKISLLYDDLEYWPTILNIVSKQINMDVYYLYTIFGERLKDPSEIQHRGFYVALAQGSRFKDISYLSVFSSKKQRKVRFKQTTQQTYSDLSLLSQESLLANQVTQKRMIDTKLPVASALNPYSLNESALINSQEVININDPNSESPCVHLTIVQRPFSASKHIPGVPGTICAIQPSARLVLEMLGDKEYQTRCNMCKSVQTSTIYCEAIPKGKCMIEVGSKKFHIICDEDAIVLPCGTYFSSHRSMKNPCTFPMGNETLTLENIASHIVGIVVDTSEFCVSRAIYGSKETKELENMEGDVRLNDSNIKIETIPLDSSVKNVVENILQSKEHELQTR